MKRPAVFFDRDNTLIANSGYLGEPSGVVLIDGAADAVARARRLGFAIVIVSNQSGVARGLFNEEAVQAVNARLDQVLGEANPAAVIDRHEFCPFHPEAVVDRYRQDSDHRKPKPGMILRAARQLALDLHRSWLIGDTARDIDAGAAAGCRTILFQCEKVSASPEAEKKPAVDPDFICSTLAEALDYIQSHLEPEPIEELTDPPPAVDAAGSGSPARPTLENLAEQILHEMKHRNDHALAEFSTSKVVAGIVQILALAVLAYAYFDPAERQTLLLLSIALQTFTTSLLIMGKQK